MNDNLNTFASPPSQRSPFLRSDRLVYGVSRAQAAAMGAMLVLPTVAWSGWFLCARVPVYELSQQARIELADAAHVVVAPVDGRVASSHMWIGEEVEEGTVLLELDSQSEELRLAECRARLDEVRTDAESLAVVWESAQAAMQAGKKSNRLEQDGIRLDIKGTEALAQYAERQFARSRRLREEGSVASSAFEKDEAEATSRRAAAEGLRLSVERSSWKHAASEYESQVGLARIEYEKKHLLGEIGSLEAQAARLEHEISLRRVRSPVAGRVAEAVPFPKWTMLKAGDRIGAVLPRGELHVVASFTPAAALGRIRPGQPGRLRLDKFPWTQYGSLATRVDKVAEEARDGIVRVELALEDEVSPRIPIAHGEPGQVEVEIEKVSPATLALRSAGGLIPMTVRPPPSDSELLEARGR